MRLSIDLIENIVKLLNHFKNFLIFNSIKDTDE